jgi:hypothetical protein
VVEFNPWRALTGVGVPPDVARTLQAQFGASSEVIGQWRCHQKRGTYVRQPVRYVRVFDPGRISGDTKPVRKYDDLNKHHDAVLFEGHRNKAGFIYLIDRRATVGLELPAMAATART